MQIAVAGIRNFVGISLGLRIKFFIEKQEQEFPFLFYGRFIAVLQQKRHFFHLFKHIMRHKSAQKVIWINLYRLIV